MLPLALWAALRGAARWIAARAGAFLVRALALYAIGAALAIVYGIGRLWWWVGSWLVGL